MAGSRTLTPRRIIAYGLGLAALLAASGAAALVLLGPFELAPVAAARLSRVLHRPVAIATLKVGIGAPVTVALRDLTIDNLPGGSQHPFMKLARLEAEIAPLSVLGWLLLDRPPTVRRLSVAGIAVSMEHGADGRPNWHFGDRSSASPADPRTRVPTLLDARLSGGDIEFHTSGGHLLQFRLDEVAVSAAAGDQPVNLTMTGSYNAAPLRLSAGLQSFDRLHDAAAPFGAEVHVTSDETHLDFAGTLTRPLAVDGIAGRMTLAAPNLDRLLMTAGLDGRVSSPLTVAAAVGREGNLWHLSDGGTLGGQPFRLTAQLREGARRAPDDIAVDADFALLDLAAVHGGVPFGERSLRLDADPGTLVDAHVTAKRIVDGERHADDLVLRAKLAPGALAIDQLAGRVFGGTADLKGSVTNTEAGAVVRLDGSLSGGDAKALSGLLAIGPLPLTGSVEMRLGLDATGATVSEAGRSVRGGLALAMTGGSIGRSVVERASTDVRLLFRASEGAARIDCLLGLMSLRDGVGRIAPLRLRTSDGTVLGAGTLDLRRDSIDLTFATESATTSVFALDVPVRVAGPILAPRMLPALGGPDRGIASLDGLSQPVQDLARGNSCLGGKR